MPGCGTGLQRTEKLKCVRQASCSNADACMVMYMTHMDFVWTRQPQDAIDGCASTDVQIAALVNANVMPTNLHHGILLCPACKQLACRFNQ